MFTNGVVGADYQPIVDLASNRICGWEALARYRPNPATYSALDLVEAARQHDLLDELTWAIVSNAHATLTSAARIVDVPLIMSVNIEIEQLRHDSELFGRIASMAWPEQTRLVLEITERGQDLWHDDYGRAARALRELDIMLALDDFGAGAARLTFLQHPEWALVKFDRQLIASEGRTELIVMSHTARMFSELGVLSVAEGIETPEQLANVRAHGIEMGQGYLLGRPATPTYLLEALERDGLQIA
jgi:EAL domain-containing protein (putative c-di-GMP-specific phosphodiesterase class I)